MRNLSAIVVAALVLSPAALAQNWKQVHRADEAKWAKTTGLDTAVIHKLSRAASGVPDEKDDESRIANIDLEGLAVRHDVMFVTYAGENNCLTVTVFRQLSEDKFTKVWSVGQSPKGTSFCDTAYGNAATDAEDGQVLIRVPQTVADGGIAYTQFTYAWNGINYRFAGEKLLQKER